MRSGLFFSFVICHLTSLAQSELCSHEYPRCPGDLQLRSAILQLRYCGNTGSGFIIDRVKGLVLTAAHVVERKDCHNQLDSVIVGSNPGSITSLNLRIVKSDYKKADCNSDVALLQVTNSDWEAIQSEFDELDFSSEPADPRDAYRRISLLKDSKDFVESKPEYLSRATDCGYWYKDNVEESVSGSPLLNRFGMVVGICVEEKNAIKAKYIDTDQFLPLIDQIPMDERMQKIDQEVISKTLDSKLFCDALNPNRPPVHRIRNFELYKWTKVIGKKRQFYVDDRNAYIITALGSSVNRGISKYFIRLLAREVAARECFRLGQALLLSTDTAVSTARELLTNSSRLYGEELQLLVNKYPTEFVRTLVERVDAKVDDGWRELSIGTLVAANVDVSSGALSKPIVNRVAWLSNEYALCNLYLAKIEKGASVKDTYLKEATMFAAIAAGFRDNPATQGMSYALLGRTLFHQEDYPAAVAALGRSWTLGQKEEWVQSNFNLIARTKLRSEDYSIDKVNALPELNLGNYVVVVAK